MSEERLPFLSSRVTTSTEAAATATPATRSGDVVLAEIDGREEHSDCYRDTDKAVDPLQFHGKVAEEHDISSVKTGKSGELVGLDQTSNPG